MSARVMGSAAWAPVAVDDSDDRRELSGGLRAMAEPGANIEQAVRPPPLRRRLPFAAEAVISRSLLDQLQEGENGADASSVRLFFAFALYR
jgi:hypothetical protein